MLRLALVQSWPSRLAILILVLTSSLSWAQTERVSLQKGWSMESGCKVEDDGSKISAAGYDVSAWHKTMVPNTVVGALVEDKTYPDPYVGMTLRTLPGMNYPIGEFFSNMPMPTDSPFRCAWWYRTEFMVPAAYRGKRIALHFSGINYRANIWLNGKRIAADDQVRGAFRIYEFDVTDELVTEKNALAVEVFAPTEKDLAITWVDWNPYPPDKDMGLWRDVFLTASGLVEVEAPYVTSKVDRDNDEADVTVHVPASNKTDHPVKGTLRASFDQVAIQQEIELAAGERNDVAFSPQQFAALKIKHPRLWWPAELGKPELHKLKVTFQADGAFSDEKVVDFGIREVTSQMLPNNHLLFKINGRPILIRGGGWSSDMLLRPASQKRLDAEIGYTRDMGLNTIRLEGKLENDEFYETTDRMGILVMAGWCCCDMWEMWDKWPPENKEIAKASLRDQIRRLRQHPSVFVWLNGSDNPPVEEVERAYLQIEKEENWANPVVSSASETPTKVTGPSGVKMTGPYDYVPPNYWLVDTRWGGAHGFNTETSPGPAIPTMQSLARMMGNDHLWPQDKVWNYHSGGERFQQINLFNNALEKRYGKPADLADFERKSQAMAYEGQRAMFEAYARNKYTSTGVIQWMLNNAWPSIIWHLYDYYLVPAGGYFGTKTACEPIHAMYSYDDNSIAVINSTMHDANGLKLFITLLDSDSKVRYLKTIPVNIGPDGVQRPLTLPEIADLSKTYFLKLELKESNGKLLSNNFYWLSTTHDAMDLSKNDGIATTQTAFADFTSLNQLPPTTLHVVGSKSKSGTKTIIHTSLKNTGKSISFLTHLRLSDAEGHDVVPVFWQDNYVNLLPGESRTIDAEIATEDMGKTAPVLHLDGWNVQPQQFLVK